MVAEKVQAFAHIAPEALELGFGGEDVGSQFFRAEYNVTSLTHREIAAE